MKKFAFRALLVLLIGAAASGYWLHERSDQPEDPDWLRQAKVAVVHGAGFAQRAVEPLRPAEPAARRFMTAPVERGTIRQTVTATGTLQALVTVEVGTQLSGQLARLFADFNDEVAKDQPLAQLDVKTYEARHAEARAATAMAEANVEIQRARLERARVDARDAEAQRAVLQARVDNARVRLESAEAALQRAETLEARGAATPLQVSDARSERDQAAASLREAEAIAAAHEIAVEGRQVDLQRTAAELANALASVPQHRAAERAAEIDLERTTIRSPVDGVVVGRNVSEGQTVAASLEAPTLFTIAGDLHQMEIHARVDEADIGKVSVGQHAAFTVDAHPTERFEAVVTGVRKAPQVIQNVVTYTVVLATDNPDMLLLPGMTATVRITIHDTGPVLRVPMAALRFSPAPELAAAAADGSVVGEGHPAMVWQPGAGGAPEPVVVGLGTDDGAYAAVLSGAIEEGDEVIVSELFDEAPARLLGIRLGF